MSIQKIVKTFVQTKLEDHEIPPDTTSLEILRLADKDNRLYKFKNIHFCCYKTSLDDTKKAVLMVFSIKDESTGSSSSSEAVMQLVYSLESQFTPILEYKYERNVDGINKNIGLLKIVKEI